MIQCSSQKHMRWELGRSESNFPLCLLPMMEIIAACNHTEQQGPHLCEWLQSARDTQQVWNLPCSAAVSAKGTFSSRMKNRSSLVRGSCKEPSRELTSLCLLLEHPISSKLVLSQKLPCPLQEGPIQMLYVAVALLLLFVLLRTGCYFWG